jgi:tRNA uridine 5-carbamoylmethylation protein Kti12
MKTCVILRGLPGSGKSWLAEQLYKAMLFDGLDGAYIVSADDFFIDPDTRQYKWYKEGLAAAHATCFQKFVESIEFLKDVQNGMIIVDNTNAKHSEYTKYKKLAEESGYWVQVITVGEFTEDACQLYARQNTHGVPYEVIKRRAEVFQK